MISKMTQPLSAEQVQSFQDNGYLIVRGLAAIDEVAQFRRLAEIDLVNETLPIEFEADVHYPGAPSSRQAQGGDTTRRLLEAYGRNPHLAAWGEEIRVTWRLAQLFGNSQLCLVQSHHNCIMTKHPRYSSLTNWHQDARYWSFQNPNLISVWLALGREMQANGGMQLIPGTHRLQFESHRYDAEKFLRQDLAENQALMDQAVLAELGPGDVLFFHAALFHAAGRNLTQRRKFALVYTYRTAENLPVENSNSTRLPDIPLSIELLDEP